MDKSKLYYLVQRGTNNRAQTLTKDPLIIDEVAVDRALKDYSELYEKITIEEFGRKFAIKVDDNHGKE